MIKSKNRIEVTERDIDLFRYLHERKIATIDQIGRDCYATLRRPGLYQRLLRLEKEKLIQGFISSSTDNKKVYNLTRLCFKSYVQDGEVKRNELKSDSIKHDLGLVDIGHVLLKSKFITQYQTENSLQTWPIKILGEKFEPFVRNNSDAAIELVVNGVQLHFALEYEIALKKNERYYDKIRNYYNESGITRVLYVLKDEASINLLMELETVIDETKRGKFYYTHFAKLVQNQDMTFINCQNKLIEL